MEEVNPYKYEALLPSFPPYVTNTVPVAAESSLWWQLPDTPLTAVLDQLKGSI